jgi:hypothetical protein
MIHKIRIRFGWNAERLCSPGFAFIFFSVTHTVL